MLANSISQLNPISNPFAAAGAGARALAQAGNTQAFGEVLSGVMQVINETNVAQIEADTAQLDFITGRSDNMLTVLLAQERAFASMNFTVNIVNRAVSAYQEIMRMQV